jgi:polygalacturonase
MIAVSNILFALLLAQGTYAACVGTISSLDDVAGAITCTTININSFTVPAGKTFSLALADKTTVNLCKSDQSFNSSFIHLLLVGDITFGTKNWAGPLFQVTGKDIICEGDNPVTNRGVLINITS